MNKPTCEQCGNQLRCENCFAIKIAQFNSMEKSKKCCVQCIGGLSGSCFNSECQNCHTLKDERIAIIPKDVFDILKDKSNPQPETEQEHRKSMKEFVKNHQGPKIDPQPADWEQDFYQKWQSMYPAVINPIQREELKDFIRELTKEYYLKGKNDAKRNL